MVQATADLIYCALSNNAVSMIVSVLLKSILGMKLQLLAELTKISTLL